MGQMTHGTPPRADPAQTASVALPMVIVAGVALAMLWDVWGDIGEVSVGHLLLEGVMMLLLLAGLGLLLRRWRAERTSRRRLTRTLTAAQAAARDSSAEAARWRAEAQALMRGLGAAIDQQFDRWGLTEAEREVGLLQLKGLSHKDIAAVRGTSERTVRQQALAIYRKGGVGGRAELSAFFLEDLLLPRDGLPLK